MEQERRPVGRPRKNRDGTEDPRESRKVPQVDTGRQPIKLPPWDGKMRGPLLGKLNPRGEEWHPQTIKWWKVWRKSPQAMFCEPTDWEALLIAALIYDQMMKGCSHTALANLSSEVRRLTGAVGASIEDRIRLGMSPEKPNKEVEEAKVKQGVEEVVDYMKRLGDRIKNEPS